MDKANPSFRPSRPSGSTRKLVRLLSNDAMEEECIRNEIHRPSFIKAASVLGKESLPQARECFSSFSKKRQHTKESFV